MDKEEVLGRIKKRLIVSCQARVGWAMYGSDIMAAFAVAAYEGGAGGIRATGSDNILAIKKKVALPIIGINKCFSDDCDVYITPTYESAEEILECGIEIIALDATSRKRPNDEKLEDIVKKIRENYPKVLIMGEIATFEEALEVLKMDFDMISTTLSGYTDESKDVESVNIELIRKLKSISNIPVIAEGRIRNEIEARQVLEAGAFSVVVGTAITRPEIITERFVEEINKVKTE